MSMRVGVTYWLFAPLRLLPSSQLIENHEGHHSFTKLHDNSRNITRGIDSCEIMQTYTTSTDRNRQATMQAGNE
jgi:hypothetical protein